MPTYGLLVNLIVDALFSWGRMFIALFISILLSIVIGVYAATSRKAERVILPIIDILQTIPILAFFPIALIVFVVYLPGYIGINAAVIFLIVTSMLWNIIFGVYESIKTIPGEFLEVADLYRMNMMQKLRKIFIPAALPRIVQQSILSWSIGLFYLVTSEIFSYGTSACCRVQHGIGAALVELAPGAPGGSVGAYLMGIAVFIAFVIATRFLFFKPLEDYADRYTKPAVKSRSRARPAMFVSWFSKRIATQQFGGFGTGIAQKRKARRHAYTGGANAVQEAKPAINKWAYYAVAIAAIALLAVYAVSVNSRILAYEYMTLTSLLLSFARIWLAFALITAIALPVCVYLIFISRQSSKYLLFFQIAASIPATILLPGIAIAFSGFPFSSELVAFTVFFMSGIWYVIFSIIASTRTLPPSIFEVKKLFGVKGRQAWKSIYIKALLPGFITGALTGIAAEWNASIVAECFTTGGITTNGTVISCVNAGIGKLLDSTAGSGNLVLMAVALLNLVVMILLINTFVWKRMYRNVAKVYR